MELSKVAEDLRSLADKLESVSMPQSARLTFSMAVHGIESRNVAVNVANQLSMPIDYESSKFTEDGKHIGWLNSFGDLVTTTVFYEVDRG